MQIINITNEDYHFLRKYELYQTRMGNTTLYYITAEELFDIIYQEHFGVRHGARDITTRFVSGKVI